MNMTVIQQHVARSTTKMLVLLLQCTVILCLCGLFTATAAQAQMDEDEEVLAKSPYTLEANPSVCISYDREQPCIMPLRLRWQGPASNELCLQELLHEPLKKAPFLQCWQQQQRGEMDLQFSNTTDVDYQLQEQTADTTVAATSVKVINRDLRNSRKRRRHVWSIL
jgi:hypothetical protein